MRMCVCVSHALIPHGWHVGRDEFLLLPLVTHAQHVGHAVCTGVPPCVALTYTACGSDQFWFPQPLSALGLSPMRWSQTHGRWSTIIFCQHLSWRVSSTTDIRSLTTKTLCITYLVCGPSFSGYPCWCDHIHTAHHGA